MKTAFFLLFLASLAFFANCQEFCCTEETQIPDLRSLEIEQSVSGSNSADCNATSFTYTHSAYIVLPVERYDASHLSICVSSSDEDCSQLSDYSPMVTVEAGDNVTLSYNNAKRVGTDPHMVFIRANNCAGYSIKQFPAIDFQAPRITSFTTLTNSASLCDSDTSITFEVVTSGLVEDVELCIEGEDDCITATYSATSNRWTASTQRAQGETFSVTAKASNCIKEDVPYEQQFTAARREQPNLNPRVSFSPSCDGYGISAIVSTNPQDTTVEACLLGEEEECKEITGTSVTFDRTLNVPSETDASVRFNISTSCTGDDVTTQSGSVTYDITPQPNPVTLTSCRNTEVSSLARATIPSTVYDLDGDVRFCVDHGDGFECEVVTSYTSSSDNRIYTSSVSSNITSTTPLSAKWNTTVCDDTEETTFSINRAFTPAPVAPGPLEPSYTNYCEGSSENVTVSLSFNEWTNGQDEYELKYTFPGGEEVTKDIDGVNSVYTVSFELPPGATNVPVTITGYNCDASQQDSITVEVSVESKPDILISADDITVTNVATASLECASEPQRTLNVVLSNILSGVEYELCIYAESESIDDCEWQTMSSFDSSERLDANKNVPLVTDSEYTVVVRGRYAECEDLEYPHQASATKQATTPAAVVQTRNLMVEDTKDCQTEDCVPGKRFSVDNSFQDFLTRPEDNTLATYMFCWSDDSDCTVSTPMTKQGNKYTHKEVASSSDVSDYTFKVAAVYCEDPSENVLEKQESIAAHSASNGDDFNVTMSVDLDSCNANIAFEQFADFDSRVDSFRYCIGSPDEPCTNGWYTTSSENSVSVSLDESNAREVVAYAYPARCSGYFMEDQEKSTSFSLPSQPQFGSDAAVEGEFTVDEDNCRSYQVSVSWDAAPNADQYSLCPHLGDENCLLNLPPVSDNSYEFEVPDVSPFADQTIYLKVTALKNCAGGERSSITGQKTVPTPECGSDSGSGASSTTINFAIALVAVIIMIGTNML